MSVLFTQVDVKDEGRIELLDFLMCGGGGEGWCNNNDGLYKYFTMTCVCEPRGIIVSRSRSSHTSKNYFFIVGFKVSILQLLKK